MSQDYSIRSIQRALAILKCFNENQKKMSLMDFVEMVDLNKSTTYRILTNLVEMGFIEQENDGEYTVGHELFRLGSLCNNNDILKKAAHEALLELNALTGETVVLTKYKNGILTCVDKIESDQPLRITSNLGANIPMLMGATGKSVASCICGEMLDFCIESQKQSGCPIPEDVPRLREQLKEIKEQGYCVTESELNQDVTALAVPLINRSGLPLGSISVIGPSSRLRPNQITNIVPETLKIVQKLREEIYYLEQ